jgi:hypothetical protein
MLQKRHNCAVLLFARLGVHVPELPLPDSRFNIAVSSMLDIKEHEWNR